MSISTGKDGYQVLGEFAQRTHQVLHGTNTKLKAQDCDLLPEDNTALKWVQAMLRGCAKGSLLDFGCGYGRWAKMLDGLYERYYGIDTDRERIAYAQAHYRSRIVPYNPDFQLIDLSSPSVGMINDPLLGVGMTPRYDTILSVNVLQHLPLPLAIGALRVMKRHLAPGGQCLLWEGRITDGTLEEAEAQYAKSDNPRHMIPKPISALVEGEPGLHWGNSVQFPAVGYILTHVKEEDRQEKPEGAVSEDSPAEDVVSGEDQPDPEVKKSSRSLRDREKKMQS